MARTYKDINKQYRKEMAECKMKRKERRFRQMMKTSQDCYDLVGYQRLIKEED